MKPETTHTEELHTQSNLEQLADDVKSYIATLVELSKLKLIDKLSTAGAGITTYVILTIAFLFGLMMLSIGIAAWINYCMNSSFAGYFIVAGVYVVSGLIMLWCKPSIRKPINSAIIRSILDEK